MTDHPEPMESHERTLFVRSLILQGLATLLFRKGVISPEEIEEMTGWIRDTLQEQIAIADDDKTALLADIADWKSRLLREPAKLTVIKGGLDD